jgi:hypothetical protein
MKTKDPDHDHEPDDGPSGEPDKGPASDPDSAKNPALSESALTSLQKLEALIRNVDTSPAGGRPGVPLLQFKRDGNGTWCWGQKKTVVEDGSRWAANPLTFKWGWICFGNNKKVIGERLVPVSKPMPDVDDLPVHPGFEWQQEWSVNFKCIGGTDAGLEVI